MYFTWTLFHQLLESKIFSLGKHITDNDVKNAYPVQTSDDTGHGPGLNVYLSSVEHNSTAKKLYYSMVADNYKFAVQFRNLFWV